LFEIKVDEDQIRKMYDEKLKEHIEQIEKETMFWDSNELRRQTRMCWNTIQDKFFYDERFPKIRVGKKWYFHSEKTKEFLDTWFAEQR
jgi:hypothetical protein